jgi:hypothetical protein
VENYRCVLPADQPGVEPGGRRKQKLLKLHVLCFKGSKLHAAEILLIIRSWALWFDRSFITGDVEEELTLMLFTKMLSVAVLESV